MTAVGVTLNVERLLSTVAQMQAEEQRSYHDSNVVCSSQARPSIRCHDWHCPAEGEPSFP